MALTDNSENRFSPPNSTSSEEKKTAVSKTSSSLGARTTLGGTAQSSSSALRSTSTLNAVAKPAVSTGVTAGSSLFSSKTAATASTLSRSTVSTASASTSAFSKTPASAASASTFQNRPLSGSAVSASTTTTSGLSGARTATGTVSTAPAATSARPATSTTTASTAQSSFVKTATTAQSSKSSLATSQSTVARTASSSLFTRTATAAATTNTSTATTAASSTQSPVDNNDIAKKLAEAKAALSTVNNKTASVMRTDADGRTSLIKDSQEVTDVQYRRFAAFIEEKSGIVLGAGKQYLVNSRLSSLLSKFHIQTVDELINRAMEETPNNKIQEEVIDAMTTNETLWFRDTYPYTALENTILPELAKRAKYPVRIWSAACSSGQEPYSIAMIVQEQLGKMLHVDPKQTQIIGTDLSPEMLTTCRLGQYDVHALSRGLSAERKAKFFKPCHKPNMMQIDSRVKSMVEFRPMNLLGSYALMGKFDVIFCRNVLIYFSNEVKADILRKLTMCLNPGGYLILGSTETLVGVSDKYEMMRCNPGIIYRLKPQKYAFL